MPYSISVLNTVNCTEFKNKAACDRLVINARKLGEATIYEREEDFHNTNMWCYFTGK